MSDIGPLIQNFDSAQGASVTVNFDVNPDTITDLVGASIYWNIYKQQYGVPYGDPVVSKAIDDGIQIDDPNLLLFHADLSRDDTKGLDPDGYYHECTVVDRLGKYAVTTAGIWTVTQTRGSELDI